MTLPRAACSALACLILLLLARSHSTLAEKAPTIPQCTRVTLNAAYLARVPPTASPGFLLDLRNDTDAPIKVVLPFPTSVHWYAQVGSRWLWRSSSGSGGALVDALRERGPVFAYRPPAAAEQPVYRTVPAHDHLEWEESIEDNPVLRFRPGCERCSNPQDQRFQAVLAYAYVAAGGAEQGLLSCGLRSGAVVMPPLE